MQNVDLISAACGWGAGHHEAAFGPAALAEFGIFDFVNQKSHHSTHHLIEPFEQFQPGEKISYEQRLALIKDFDQKLADQMKVTISGSRFPLVLGGDHSIAIGTWSGIISALNAEGEFGLIWFDAHMDAHTPQTTPSTNIHGMPLASLLGFGEPSLITLASKKVKLNPEHVVLIGVRSYESEEAALLEKLNVKVFFMDDIKKMGIKAVLKQAEDIVTRKTKAFGISIDLDAFDPAIAPGTGTPEPNGLMIEDVAQGLRKIAQQVRFVGAEIVEYDPTRDENQKTATLVKDLINILI